MQIAASIREGPRRVLCAPPPAIRSWRLKLHGSGCRSWGLPARMSPSAARFARVSGWKNAGPPGRYQKGVCPAGSCPAEMRPARDNSFVRPTVVSPRKKRAQRRLARLQDRVLEGLFGKSRGDPLVVNPIGDKISPSGAHGSAPRRGPQDSNLRTLQAWRAAARGCGEINSRKIFREPLTA